MGFLFAQEAERTVLASLQQQRDNKLQAEPTLRCPTSLSSAYLL